MVEAVNAIELKNITKRFGEKVIANDSVNLTVRKGEILSLLGENGSGKTTLMNMLSGIYFPDEGQIFVNGKEVMISSPKDAFDLGIGMIHQHFKLIEVLTAAENIILGLPGKMTLNMDEVIKDIQALVDKYGFELDCRKKIYEMSVSEKLLLRRRRLRKLRNPTVPAHPAVQALAQAAHPAAPAQVAHPAVPAIHLMMTAPAVPVHPVQVQV